MDLKQLSITTFNLYNLNEPGLRLYRDSDGWSEDEYQRKIDWTARNLKGLPSDVFGFQELWHAASLKRAVQRAGLAADYDELVPNNADGKKIVCAALVRKGLRVGQAEWISDFPPKFVLKSSGEDAQTPDIQLRIKGFSRPVLHFAIRPRTDGPDIHVYVCHFKSKGPTDISRESWFEADEPTYAKHRKALGAALSTLRRTAEAAALRFLLTERMKGTDTPVIVIGDINDGQHSNTANILTEQPNYLVGTSLGGGDAVLYTAQTLQEYRDTRDVYYTYVHQDMRESLDHILVSQEFYDNSKKRLWLFDGLAINNDHLNFETHNEDGTNDHGIVRAAFRYKPIAAGA